MIRASGIGRRAAPIMAGVCLPVLATIYQLAATELAEVMRGTDTWRDWTSRLVHTPWGPVLLLAEASSFALWMLVLAELPLSVAFPLTATGAVFSLALAVFGMGQTIAPLALVGTGAILAGAWLIVHPAR